MPSNISNFKPDEIKYVFTDIDDTLTEEGKLHDDAYKALWDLYRKGIKVIPVTGRPAGWCEMILRVWPVEAVIGENGGFYFCFDENKKVKRQFLMSSEEQEKNQKKLQKIRDEILKKVPGSDVASDQFCRLMDLAIDFKEDVPELSKEQIQEIVSIFKSHKAQAKISSIHVNGWFGDYNKSKMIQFFCKDYFKKDFSELNKEAVFIGDSPNDEENFRLFKHSVGVKNIDEFLPGMTDTPKFVTNKVGGKGFVEMVKQILS
jgi:HAD superfamily hydrolase (TIGR01484 family)